ncbi:hypothetical protein [Mucilaginibacter xinganensis]|nr:hypothetical protein [Mucilaginibacter xinganensis]
MMFIAQGLKAQNQFLQLTLGAGAGIVTTYASPTTKPNIAFNGNACYYPLSYMNVEVEGQIGKLGGETFNQSGNNFTNKYQAGIVVLNLQLGNFLERSRDPFSTFLRNAYVGAGFGLIHNRVTSTINTDYYYHNIIPLIPIKLGYEFNLSSDFGAPILKMDLSYSFNSTLGRGLYGDYGPVSQPVNSYGYFSVNLKYAINLERY